MVRVKLWQGKQPVLVYNSEQVKRTGAAAVGNRASYVHPIYGLDGEVITDDFPKDHYHHHGLFWGWPHVTIGGKDYDFWKMHGTDIRFKRWLNKEVDKNVAMLGVENEWLVGEKPVVREEATLRVHPATAEGRLINVQLEVDGVGPGHHVGRRRGEELWWVVAAICSARRYCGYRSERSDVGGFVDHAAAVGRSFGQVPGSEGDERGGAFC